MGFFRQKKRKYDPEIVSKSASYVLSKHGSPTVAQGEVQELRDQASTYALKEYGAEIPSSAFLSTIKMTDFKDSDLRSRIVSYYKSERSIERTAKYFRTSAQTINKILTEYGVTLKTGLQTAVLVVACTSIARAEMIETAPWTIKELIDYGALGIFCLFLVGAVVYLIRAQRVDRETMLKNHADERADMHKCHAEERKAWKDTTDRQHAESMALGKQVVEIVSYVKGAINTKRSHL